MKELHNLLKYIDAYVYSYDTEMIMIEPHNDSTEAAQCYQNALSSIDINIAEYKPKCFNDERWILDIAIDCVRNMSEEDRDYVSKNTDPYEYHFGYGTGIRNKYIHCAKWHRAFRPDSVSSEVLKRIFSIIC